MKIQCDVCERAEAVVLCCADEAVLCRGCDVKVHAANKLAGKHQRVPLLLPNAASASSKMPSCDICQEKVGYFFCLEDRALLCWHCDLTIHSASPFVSHHRRFLITGARVALQQSNSGRRTSGGLNELSNSSGSNGNGDNPPGSLPPTSLAVEKTECLKPLWPWNEFFEGADFHHGYVQSDPGSSN